MLQGWFQNKRRRARKNAVVNGEAGALEHTAPMSFTPTTGGGFNTHAGSSIGISCATSSVAGVDDEADEDDGHGTRLFSSLEEYNALLSMAVELLPVPYRPDGPPLGFEFDDPECASLCPRLAGGSHDDLSRLA